MIKNDPKILFRPGEFLDPTGFFKLNTNENPYGLSADSLKKLASLLEENPSICWRYADPQSRKLRHEIAQFHNLPEECVLIGGGISEMIPWFCRANLRPQTRLAHLLPNYGFYEASWRQSPAQLFPLEAFPEKFLENALKNRQLPDEISLQIQNLPSDLDFLFLTSPNVPTGLPIASAPLRKWLGHFSGTVIIDEAYGPFGEQDFSDWLKIFANLVVFRTFSKAFGLAGLRCSYMLGNAEFLQKMIPFQMPYNVNALAQNAASLALNDRKTFAENRQKIRGIREDFQQFLSALNWLFFKSQGNFVLFRPEKSGHFGENITENLLHYLRQQGIILRHFPRHWTASFLRCSLGIPAEMEQVKNAIHRWLGEKENFPHSKSLPQ